MQLNYFPIRGLGEMCRLAAAAGGLPLAEGGVDRDAMKQDMVCTFSPRRLRSASLHVASLQLNGHCATCLTALGTLQATYHFGQCPLCAFSLLA